MNKTLAILHKQAITELTGHTDSARLDAELVLCHVLSISRTTIITQDQMILSLDQEQKILELIEKRKQSYPIAYITGSRHFWDLKLKVSEDTLIPRPETELLVETALSLFNEDQKIQILDLGTGSGAIAIAIANSRPTWNLTACDNSAAALLVAKNNVDSCQLENLELIHSNWFEAIPDQQKFDMILSNPPYIEADDPHLKQGDIQYEPSSALSSGADGLDDIRLIIANANKYLGANGCLWLEHGFDQAQKVKDLFSEHNYTDVRQHTDLSGHIRITGGKLI